MVLETTLAKEQVNVKLHFFLLVVFHLPHGLHRRLKDTGFKQLLSTNILSLLVKTARKISRKVMNTLMTFHQNNDITKTMANNTLSSMGFLETIELLRCAPRQDWKTTAPGFCARHVNIAFYSLFLFNTYHPSFEHLFANATWPNK